MRSSRVEVWVCLDTLPVFSDRFLRLLFSQPAVRQVRTLLLNLAGVTHVVDAASTGYTNSVYKTLNTCVPRYLSQRINCRVNSQTLRSTATPLLIQPFARTDFAKRSFRCAAPSGTHFMCLSSEAIHCLYSNLG